MKTTVLYILLLSLFLLNVTATSAETILKKYTNNKYRFSILLPTNWHTVFFDYTYKLKIINTRKHNTTITVTVTNRDEESTEQWNNWEKWYLDAQGTNLKKIITTKKVTLHKNITGQLHIFEYNKKKKKYLQRMLIVPYENKFFIIECGSTYDSYYHYDKIFNAVMWSLRFL